MKNLEEIIKEIQELTNDKIFATDEFYINCKNNKYSKEQLIEYNMTEKDWNKEAEEKKNNAIKFITRKFNEIDKSDYYNNTEKEHQKEIAYFKMLEQNFGIILDEKKLQSINEELNEELENFTNNLSNAFSRDDSDNNSRYVNMIFNKNGNGNVTTKINIPVPWAKKLGFTNDYREGVLLLKDDKIILMKNTFEKNEEID